MFATAATSTLIAATVGSGQGSARFAPLLLSGNLDATVHTITQAATVALIVTVCIVFYLLTCWVWPFGKCRRCKGAGKHKSPLGKAYRHCGRCGGSGLRLRIGRYVVNYIKQTRAGADNSTSKGKK